MTCFLVLATRAAHALTTRSMSKNKYISIIVYTPQHDGPWRGGAHATGRTPRPRRVAWGASAGAAARVDCVRAQARPCIARAGSTVDRRSKPAASPPAQVRVSLEATVHSKRWSKRVPLDASSSHRRARFQINPRRRPSLSLSKTAARERSTLARSSPPSAHFRLLLEVVTAEPCRRAPSGEFG